MDQTQLLPIKDNDSARKLFTEQAVLSYRKSDKSRWTSSLWCSRIVGKYVDDATKALADDMGVSPDTVEDMAHAYKMFSELCEFDNGKFRRFVFAARRSTYIYHSHFRAIHDARNKYGLNIEKCLDLLMDIVQAEGQISSRNVDSHTRSRYGAETPWTYEASQLQKKINKFLQRPDVPNDGRKAAQKLYEWIGENA